MARKISVQKIDNPFMDDYVRKEIEFYGISKYDKDGIKICTVEIIGRCDDFLNVNMRMGGLFCPKFFIDDRLWMSLTPLEIQSHYLPIKKAKGKIAVGGLGMGYYLLKVMEKDNVSIIDVYEQEQRVVDFFKENFSDRKGFEKVEFIVGDIRKTLNKEQYNFAYIDIYHSILPSAVITDKELFCSTNQISEYHFWCQEKVLKYAYEHELLTMDDFDRDLIKLFLKWNQTPASKLRDPDIDIDFVECCLDTFGF